MKRMYLRQNGFSPGKRLFQTVLALLTTVALAIPAAFGAITLPPDAEYSQARLAPGSQGYGTPGFTWQNVVPNALASYFTYVPYSNADAMALGFPNSCGNKALPGAPDQNSTEDCYTITVKRFDQKLALPAGWGFGGPGLVDDVGAQTVTNVYGYGSGGLNWTPPQFFFDTANGNKITKKTSGLATVTGNAPTLFATVNNTLVPPIPGTGIWNFPAPSIKGTFGRPIRIQWLNELPNTIIPGLDPTVDCSDSSPSCFPYNRIVTHVHGAHVGPASDGLTQAEYNPDFSVIGMKFSQSVLPASAGPPGTYFYPMDQEAATIWYHDHAAGNTHLNTNMGMAGFFPITDMNEQCLQGISEPTRCPGAVKYLPTGNGTEPSAYELGFALQDRVFYTNGQLAMPDAPVIDGNFPSCDQSSPASRLATCSPLFMYASHAANADSLTPAGVHMVPYDEFTKEAIPENADAPFLATSATLEFFGNMPVVNGVVYGKYDVEPRVYRMRFIGGTDSRTWDLQLQAYDGAGTSLGIIPFWQIGTEQGFLNNPVSRQDMLLMPGERLDALVDFKAALIAFPTMTHVMLNNLGTDAPFQGEQFTPFNRSTDIPEIMRFDLIGLGGTADVPSPTALLNLRPVSPAITTPVLADATPGVPIRRIALEEIVDEYQRIMPTIDRRGYDLPGMQATEIVRRYDTEIWDLINTTADAHPMHLHQVAFKVMHRQPFTSFTPAINDTNNSGVFAQPNYTADAGTEVPPEPHDAGYKDTVYAPPGYVTRVIAYFDLLGEYVWHCHILSHEEHDMMRPLKVVASNLAPPASLTVPLSTLGDRATTVTVAPVVPANPVPEKYYVEYKRTTDTNWTTNNLGSGTSQAFTFPVDGTYELRVKAVDAAASPTFGDSAYTLGSNTILVAPDDQITSPANGSALTSPQTFQFSTSGPYQHYLWIGTTGPGSSNLGRYTADIGVSQIIASPINGATIYVRLWVKIPGVVSNEMRYRDYTYTSTFTPATGVTLTPSPMTQQIFGSSATFTAAGQGSVGYEYDFWLHNGTSWSNVRPYSTAAAWVMPGTTPIGTYTVQVNARAIGSTAPFEVFNAVVYNIVQAPATGVTLNTNLASPQPTTVPGGVTFTAAGSGGTGSYQYDFWLHNGTTWTNVQPYSTTADFVWNTGTYTPGTYTIQVNVRCAGSTASYEVYNSKTFTLTDANTPTGATLSPDKPSPQLTTVPGGVVYTAAGLNGSGSFQYEFWLHNGTTWTNVQPYSTTATWNWNTAAYTAGFYTIQVNVRSVGSTAAYEVWQTDVFELQ